MAELTLQIPDDVADRLSPIQRQLPRLLRQLAQASPLATMAENTAASSPTAFPVYNEMLDFLVSSPSAQQIADFKASAVTQSRLRELLEINREGSLTTAEQAELDAFEQVEHIVTLLKIKARTQLKA